MGACICSFIRTDRVSTDDHHAISHVSRSFTCTHFTEEEEKGTAQITSSLLLSLLCIHKLLNLNIDIACLLLSREILNKRKASRPVVFVSFYSVYLIVDEKNDDGDDEEIEGKEKDDDDDEKTKSKLKWMIISQNSTRASLDHVRRWFEMLLLLLLLLLVMMVVVVMMWMLMIGRVLCCLRETVRKVDRVMFIIIIDIRR